MVFDLIWPKEKRPSLEHGYAVNLRIAEWEHHDGLKVPLSALFRQGKDWAVFITGGRAPPSSGQDRSHQ